MLSETEIKPRLTRLGGLLPDWEREATDAHTAYTLRRPRGPVTGFPVLDEKLGGRLEPGVHIAHGQPGAGKTAFGLQVAASCGCPALLVSCEMSVLELLRRIVARVTETALSRLKGGVLPREDAMALAERASSACPQLTLVDATFAFADPTWLLNAAKIAQGDEEHLLIVLDSIHAWADMSPVTASEYERLNAGLTALRRIAGELRCPILAIAERNRTSMESGGLAAGAGTRKIEYGAETVFDLERKGEVTRGNAMGEMMVTVKLAKNRHGAPGQEVVLYFNGALQRFQEGR